MKLQKQAGVTSEIWQVFIRDSSSTTGGGLTGLTNASSGLTAYYHRDTDTTATAISLVSMTVGSFTSSGFKEIDSANMPGWYQFCPPNAALASGAKSVGFHLKGATNMAPLPIEVQLLAVNVDDAVRMGMTALPNANAEAAGGLYTRGTGAGQINQDANGRIDVSLKAILGTALTETAGQIAAGFKKLFDVAAPVFTLTSVNQTGDSFARLGAPAGASVSADVAAVKAVLPAALVSGRIDASVGAMAASVLTATAIAADAITAAKIADGAIDAATFAAGAINAAAIAADAITDAKVASDVTISSVTGAVGSVIGAVGSVTGNVGGNVTGSVGSVAAGGITASSFAAGAIDNAAIAADAIGSSELAASAVTEIQSGLSTLDAAGVRSAVGLASANLDTQIGTLATAASLATVAGYVDTEVAAIKAKTDNLPSDPADASDIAAAFTALQSHGDGAWTTATGFLDAAGVRAAIGLASANLDTQLDALPTSAELTTALAGADDATLAAIAALNNLSAATVKTQADQALADAGVTTTVTGRIDAAISTRLASGSYTAPDNTGIAAIGAKTSNLPSDPADQSLIIAATDAVMARLGAPAGASLSADIAAVKSDAIAVKAKTDSLAFTGAAVEANIAAVNGVAVTGTGASGDEWGPA